MRQGRDERTGPTPPRLRLVSDADEDTAESHSWRVNGQRLRVLVWRDQDVVGEPPGDAWRYGSLSLWVALRGG